MRWDVCAPRKRELVAFSDFSGEFGASEFFSREMKLLQQSRRGPLALERAVEHQYLKRAFANGNLLRGVFGRSIDPNRNAVRTRPPIQIQRHRDGYEVQLDDVVVGSDARALAPD